MTEPKGADALVERLRALKAHHAFTRDRIGQPGCEVRKVAAEYVETIDKAITHLSQADALVAEERWQPGQAVTVTMNGTDLAVPGEFIQYVEGWIEVRFGDGSSAICRPSNVAIRSGEGV